MGSPDKKLKYGKVVRHRCSSPSIKRPKIALSCNESGEETYTNISVHTVHTKLTFDQSTCISMVYNKMDKSTLESSSMKG